MPLGVFHHFPFTLLLYLAFVLLFLAALLVERLLALFLLFTQHVLDGLRGRFEEWLDFEDADVLGGLATEALPRLELRVHLEN